MKGHKRQDNPLSQLLSDSDESIHLTIDAPEPLLLSEGVCQSPALEQCHSNVRPQRMRRWKRYVPTVSKVELVKSVKLLAGRNWSMIADVKCNVLVILTCSCGKSGRWRFLMPWCVLQMR